MLVETVETPNQNSLKFIPNMTVSEIGPVEVFKDKGDKIREKSFRLDNTFRMECKRSLD